MKKSVLILFLAMAIHAFAADTTVKGYLVDTFCVTDEGKEPGFGPKHTRMCLNMTDCAQSGFGVLTPDQHYIKFDKAGNDEAKKFIATLTKKDNIKVAVKGTVNGDTMTVSKIELE